MRLLLENISSVRQSFDDYLRITDAEDWNNLNLLKQILDDYQITDIDEDIRAFATCYQAALQHVADKISVPEKVEEASRRLKGIQKTIGAQI